MYFVISRAEGSLTQNHDLARTGRREARTDLDRLVGRYTGAIGW